MVAACWRYQLSQIDSSRFTFSFFFRFRWMIIKQIDRGGEATDNPKTILCAENLGLIKARPGRPGYSSGVRLLFVWFSMGRK